MTFRLVYSLKTVTTMDSSGLVSQQVKALLGPAEDQGLVPSTHFSAHNDLEAQTQKLCHPPWPPRQQVLICCAIQTQAYNKIILTLISTWPSRYLAYSRPLVPPTAPRNNKGDVSRLHFHHYYIYSPHRTGGGET